MNFKKPIICCILVSMVLSTSCKANINQNNNSKDTSDGITYCTVQKGSLQSTITGIITPSGNNQTSLFFKDVSGTLTKLNVQLNDNVKAGDVLAEIDPSAINKSIEQQQLVLKKAKMEYEADVNNEQLANIQLKEAQNDLNNEQLNYSKQPTDANNSLVVSAQLKVQEIQKTVELSDSSKSDAQADIDIANMQLNNLNDELNNCKIIAPEDGVVSFVDDVFVSDYINANKTIIKISNKNNIVVDFDTSDATYVTNGTKVKLRFNNNIYNAEIGNIENNINENSKGTRIELKVDSDKLNLASNSNVNGIIQIDNKKDVLIVPKSAVFTDGDSYWVNMSVNGKITKKIVQIGTETSTETEILAGLKEGDSIVLNY
jgi:RND family efflux transporter MFP subunit